MKNLVRKVLFTALLLLTGVAIVHGQSDEVTVSAEVITSLSITQDQDINFADIEDDLADAPTLSPDEEGGNPSGAFNDATGVNIGRFHISGAESQEFIITHDETAILDHETASDQLLFTASFAWEGGHTANNGGGTGLTVDGNGITEATSLDASGEFTLYVGGALTIGTGSAPLAPGTYETDEGFTVSVDYDL